MYSHKVQQPNKTVILILVLQFYISNLIVKLQNNLIS